MNKNNCKTNKLRKFNFLITAFVLCLIQIIYVNAQQTYTASAVKPGSSSGSFGLTGFETINPYSGNLNFSLPLLNVGGRGSTSSNVKLTVNQKHIVKWWNWAEDPYRNFYVADYYNSDFAAVDNGYSPGTLFVQKTGYAPNPYCYNNASIYQYTLTKVSFIAPDGTEYSFRDRGTNGQVIQLSTCQLNPPSRGTVFDTADGSSATFISDTTIYDENYAGGPSYYFGNSGYVVLRDGTRYRIENDKVVWQKDRNGNKISYEYINYGAKISKITDSLNREVIFEYAVQDVAPYGLCDRIIYKGFGGATRIIRISYKNLGDVLRFGYSLQTQGQLFPDIYNSACSPYEVFGSCASHTMNPQKPSAVWLPDGRSYKFQYNNYAELARVELPTGGAIEYDWVNGFSIGSGVINGLTPPYNNDRMDVYRRVTERRVYADGINLESKLTISGTESLNNNQGYVFENQYNSNNNLISKVKHYYYGVGGVGSYHLFNEFYESWKNGREYQTDVFDSNGTTLLRSSTNTWQQSSPSWYPGTADTAPVNNPHVIEATTLLADTNQISKRTFTYDSYNNLTDTYEYDYGTGAPGQFLRRSHTDYLTTNPVNNINYIGDTIHILNLPSQTWVSSDLAGNSKVSLTKFEYDNYATDQNHASLVSRSNISGHDSNFGNGYTTRGNVTEVKSFADANNQTGAVSVYTQYDIAGNPVKTIDARGYASTVSYNDNFGSPDAEARSNSAPSGLNGQSTFAFPTSATNSLGWTAYTQIDYFTGQGVNAEDINGVISKMLYNDALDRPTQTVTAVGLPNYERQTTIIYDDDIADRRVEIKSDLNALNDNLLKSESFYDGLGRTVESRRYESDGNFIVTESVPFVMVQDPQTSVWRAATKVSNPYRPNEPIFWTTSLSDSLGRGIKVITPDGAIIKTEYSGNAVTVTDQAGKKRKGISDALGRMTRVVEDADGQNLATDYVFDTLGNLRKTIQGEQSRYFMYNSLGRLLYAKQPEQETNTAFVATDSITNNSNWSVKYEYDNNGNITKATDAGGIYVQGTYDALNRLMFRNYSDTTPDVTFTYDDAMIAYSKGKITKVSSSVSETKYTSFDNAGRLLAHQQITDGQTYQTSYKYNLSGALIEETYPSGRVVKNVLDNDGDLAMVQSKKNANTGFFTYAGSFTYNAAGAVEKMQLGNGRWETAQFNNRLQITQIGLGVTDSTQNLLKLEYSYGTSAQNNGSLREQKITVPTVGTNQGFTAIQTYAYDNLNRLQSAVETISSNQTWKQTFTIDRYGNRRFDASQTTTLGSCSQAVCNPTVSTANNRFSSGQGYSYDTTGNVTQDAAGRQFLYDAENHQKEVKDANGNTIGLYLYDGEGKRVKKISAQETTIFVYNGGGQLIAEYSTNISQTPQVSYLTTDALGSPRIITDQNGNVKSRKDYAAFGEETFTVQRTSGLGYTTQDNVRQDYTGYQKDDESGLDFAQARYYNSSHGRFTSVDPLTASATIRNPQTFNRYSYVTNSPYKFVDPLGLRGSDMSCFGNSSGGGQGSTLGSCEAERSLDRYEQNLQSTLAAAAINQAVANNDQATAEAICASNSNVTCTRTTADPVVRISGIQLVDIDNVESEDTLVNGEVTPAFSNTPTVDATSLKSRFSTGAKIFLKVLFYIDDKTNRGTFTPPDDLDGSKSFSATPFSNTNSKWKKHCSGDGCKNNDFPITVDASATRGSVYIPLTLQDGTDERITLKATVFWVDRVETGVPGRIRTNVEKSDTVAFTVKVRFKFTQ